MLQKSVIQVDRIASKLIANLDARDVALWVQKIPASVPRSTLTRFLGLPWRLVISERIDPNILMNFKHLGVWTSPRFVNAGTSRLSMPIRVPHHLT